MHQLIAGVTGSGKSTLAKILSRKLAFHDKNQAVLDPYGKDEGGWWTDNVFEDGDRFLDFIREKNNYFIFVDEAPEYMGQYDEKMQWLGTNARHHGHFVTIITQRPQDVNKTARLQMTKLKLFHIDPDTANHFAQQFTSPKLQHAPNLPQLYFYSTSQFSGASMKRINFP